jgi:hypothetical protein
MAFSSVFNRDIEINSVLDGPFGGIEVTRFLTRPPYEPETLLKF